MTRRLVIEMIGGRAAVRDRARPEAQMVDVELDDRRVIAVASHLCGWHEDGRDSALWPTEAAARGALIALGAGGEGFEGIAELARPVPTLLPAAEDARLVALVQDHPGAWVDGPHRDEDGEGWHLVISGTSELEWIVGRGPSARDAARDALDQAARRARGAGADR